jgi:hypothetical protein
MDPEYQEKYEKYKMTVKKWELDFKKKNNGRIPSKVSNFLIQNRMEFQL